MDSQNPECNLHVESQRNASLENELLLHSLPALVQGRQLPQGIPRDYSKFLLSIVYIKWVIYILRSFL